MSTEKKQSAIAEVRDQLSLDYADGKYLDRIGSNLGLERPVFGFSDDQWRALVKVLALQYKQIATKFQDALDIVLGPRITKAFTLAVKAFPGDTKLRVNTTAHLPQTGTLVLDDGLATRESIPYSFIDRVSNTIYLSDTVVHTHEACVQDVETAFVTIDDFTVAPMPKIVVSDARFLPTTFPFTMVLGAGTGYEQTISVTGVDTPSRTLTLSTPLTVSVSGAGPKATLTSSTVSSQPHQSSLILPIADSSKFKESGLVEIGPRSKEYLASSGTTTSVTVSAPSFQTGTLALGAHVVFPDMASPNSSSISSFTTTTLSLATALSAPASGRFYLEHRTSSGSSGTTGKLVPGTSPSPFPEGNTMAGYKVSFVSGTLKGVSTYIVSHSKDEAVLADNSLSIPASSFYTISPVVPYGSNDQTTNSLLLSSAPVPTGSSYTRVLDGAKVEFLSTKTKVTLAPGQIKGVGWDIIQSEPRRVEIFVPQEVQDIGDTRSASYLHTAHVSPTPSTTLSSGVSAGASTLPVASTANFPFAGVLVIGSERVAYSVKDSTSFTIPSSSTLDTAYFSGAAVTLYQPRYGTTSLLEGNLWSVADTFPGPYLYSEMERAPSGTVAASTLSTPLAGSTQIGTFCALGSTAIEVLDASSFPSTGFPISIQVGQGTANAETASLTGVSLANRTYGATAISYASSTNRLKVSSLDPQSPTFSMGGFPNVGRYRVRTLSSAGALKYTVVVSGTYTSGTDYYLVLDPAFVPASFSIAGGDTVELVNDVLSVASLANSHNGLVSFEDSNLNYPELDQDGAESLNVLYNSVDLVSGTGFPSSGSTIHINFGSSSIPVASKLDGAVTAAATSVVLSSSNGFPTVYDYTITLAPGTSTEERVTVSNNNTGTNTLTLKFKTRYAHADETEVLFTPGLPEIAAYTTLSTNTLNFSTPVTVSTTHHVSAPIMVSSGFSVPLHTGYDFPFRLPSDIAVRLKFLFDYIRAAGVKVTVIYAR